MDISKLGVSKIRQMSKNLSYEEYENFINLCKIDERKGVNNIALSLIKKKDKYEAELARIDNMKAYEELLQKKGYKYIAGIDEVGRGPLCGPVVTACVVLKPESKLLYVNDSKKLSCSKREELYDKILSDCISYGIGIMDNNIIDEVNILGATKLAMLESIEKMSVTPDIILIDAVSLDTNIKQKAFIKGDEKIYSIGAASIVAKVYRDRLMDEYDKMYPGYNLKSNKGYGTSEHIDGLREFGPCEIHRKTFIQNIVKSKSEIGSEYEEVVCNYLAKKGYEIIKRNYKCRYGEIDIITKRNNVIIFVEVKGRKNNNIPPRDAVNESKQRKIILSAKKYLKDNNITESLCRFDVVEIINEDRGSYNINIIKNAFI